jgi:hypothetical protein
MPSQNLKMERDDQYIQYSAKVISSEAPIDLSLAKSHVPWVKDKQHSKENRETKMPEAPENKTSSIKNKGNRTKTLTDSPLSHASRIPWNKGFPLSEETKRKMSEAHKGKAPTFKGRKHSVESRLRQSLAHKGKHPSEQTRLKISKSVKRYFAKRRVGKESIRNVYR